MIKKNIKLFIGIIIGILLTSTIVYAATLIASDITYDNTKTNINANNVQEAIDVLYAKANNPTIPETYKDLATPVTATASDILNGKTAYKHDGTIMTGSIGTYTGTTIYDPTYETITIPTAGKYLTNNIVINGISSTYKNLTSQTTVTANALLNGIVAYNQSGQTVTGNIETYNVTGHVTPTTSSQTLSTSGKYVNDDIVVDAIPSTYKNLSTATTASANNIVSGKTAYDSDGNLIVGNMCIDCVLSVINDNDKCAGNNCPKCKRAGILHSNGSTVYGNVNVTTNVLKSGDAFNCDVNNDGLYEDDERFYYLSDYYDTDNCTFNTNVAILIFYTNIEHFGGLVIPSTNFKTSKATSNYANGPTNAKLYLPTTSQWSNISLFKTSRKVLKDNTTCSSSYPTISYSGYAARFLTIQEAKIACNLGSSNYATNALNNCTYMMENLDSNGTFWLEGNSANYSDQFPYVRADQKRFGLNTATSSFGIRPVIEINKTDMEY